MSTRDVPMAVHAALEGDGYWKSKGEQWQLLCPHMSSTAKIALGILCSLTGQTHPVRKLTAAELAGLLSKGPAVPGKDPKGMSTSGAIRVLRELADLGQLTRPDGARLTISSRPTAELAICVWKRPRHDCECARNVHDALNILRGENRWFLPSSPGQNSDQPPNPGENSDQPGQNSHQAGQNSAKTPPLTCDDEPPLSLSPSSPSLSGDSPATAEVTGEEREEGETDDDAGSPDEPRLDLPEQRAAADAGADDVTAVVSAYTDAMAPTRPTQRILARMQKDASDLLTLNWPVEHLVRLAGELPSKGYTSLARHADYNPPPSSTPRRSAPPADRCQDHPAFTAGDCSPCRLRARTAESSLDGDTLQPAGKTTLQEMLAAARAGTSPSSS